VLLVSPLAEGPFGALPGWLWLAVGLLALELPHGNGL
jgi:hypothetical protein